MSAPCAVAELPGATLPSQAVTAGLQILAVIFAS